MTCGRWQLPAGLAVAGPGVATPAWILASAAQSGYDSTRDDLSALAAGGAGHPWITVLGEVVLAAGIIALAAGLARSLPAGMWRSRAASCSLAGPRQRCK